MKKLKNNDLIEFIKYDWINLIPFGFCLAMIIFLCVLAYLTAFDVYKREDYKYESECVEFYKKNGYILEACEEYKEKLEG